MWVIVIVVILFVMVEALDYRIGADEYNSRFSFSKALDAKMKYFPDTKVSWLKFYMNLVLPFAFLFSFGGMLNAYQAYDIASFEFITSAMFFATSAMNAILFRGIDSTTYKINVISTLVFMFVILTRTAASAFAFFGGVVWVIISIINLFYFRKKRKLFLCTEKQLKEEYGLE